MRGQFQGGAKRRGYLLSPGGPPCGLPVAGTVTVGVGLGAGVATGVLGDVVGALDGVVELTTGALPGMVEGEFMPAGNSAGRAVCAGKSFRHFCRARASALTLPGRLAVSAATQAE